MYSETNGRKKLGIRWHSLAALVICLWAVELRAAEPQFRAFRGTVPGSYNYWFFDPQTEPDERAHLPAWSQSVRYEHGQSEALRTHQRRSPGT